MICEIILAGEQLDGKSVRVVGRVTHYDASRSVAVLSEPNKTDAALSDEKLTVDTRLVEAADFRPCSQVMLIGELEKCQGQTAGAGKVTGDVVLKARVSRCVDRLDYALYCRAVDVWRTYDASEG
ncbi:unnamed protein product [Candidula unifasciata]|uniref:Uncharacterized protein n=1 Tax=Candidula unifasciata TaxID=100452 RepID=A0A8S3ZYP1_9EUPU|nr:unnamed protein product [Candidula unifasciata]